MPIYEYGCAKCGETFEQLQKMSDPPPKKCPECGSKRVSKLMSGGALVFKGSGFYITDYKDKGGAKKEAEKKPAKAACQGCPSADGCGAN